VNTLTIAELRKITEVLPPDMKVVINAERPLEVRRVFVSNGYLLLSEEPESFCMFKYPEAWLHVYSRT
jgi:hypothetical protein